MIIRAGNGQSKDRQVDRNMADAKRVGLLRSAYWFANPKAVISGAGQGRLLADAHHRYGCELPPMWDAEAYESEAGPNPILAGAPAARWLADMVHVVDAGSARFSIGYSGASYWNRTMTPGRFDRAFGRFTGEWADDLEFLHSHDFIHARYPGWHRVPPLVGKIVDYLPRGVAPAAWSQVALATGKEPAELAGRPRTWDAWQWSAGGNAQGPVYGCQSSDLDLNIARAEAWARWANSTKPPDPVPVQGDDDMQVQLLNIEGYAAKLLANCPDAGDPLRCCWSGPATDSTGTTNDRIEWFRQCFRPTARQPKFEMGPFSADLLKNISLDDELPPGMSADLFANTAAIEARMSQGTRDPTAQKRIDDLQGTVASLDGEVGRIRGWAHLGAET